MSIIDAWLGQYPITTRGTYARVLASFVAATGKAVVEATQDDVAKYHAGIAEASAPSTVATKLAVLSSFFAYLVKRGIRTDNPMMAVTHRPKVDKQRSVQWLSNEEQRALLTSVGDSGDHAVDARNRALVWVALHGLRLAEMVSLNVEDYHDGEAPVHWQGRQEPHRARAAAG